MTNLGGPVTWYRGPLYITWGYVQYYNHAVTLVANLPSSIDVVLVSMRTRVATWSKTVAGAENGGNLVVGYGIAETGGAVPDPFASPDAAWWGWWSQVAQETAQPNGYQQQYVTSTPIEQPDWFVQNARQVPNYGAGTTAKLFLAWTMSMASAETAYDGAALMGSYAIATRPRLAPAGSSSAVPVGAGGIIELGAGAPAGAPAVTSPLSELITPA